MLIRHDPHLSRGRVLLPVPRREWMPSSQFIPKDQLGNDTVRTRFRLTARLHDGKVAWRGWFDDRDDADAFLEALFSGSLHYERALWDIPRPGWHPAIGPEVFYDFMAQTILTTAGSNQTYTSPADWDNASNTVECLGGGGSAGCNYGGNTSFRNAAGAGGGAYSKISNFEFASPGSTTATYQVGGGVNGTSRTSAGAGNGTAGNPTWWNNTVNPGNGTTNAQCSAAAGARGTSVTNGNATGGNGGAASASWGQTKYAGGKGGDATRASNGYCAAGGAGAAGPSGAGGAGVDISTGSSAGGTANNGTTSGGAVATNGNNGTEFSASYGSGSGGGGNAASSGTASGGSGGNYGAGGGGVTTSSGTGTGGAGTQGLIVVTYTPYVGADSLIWNPYFQLQHILVR